MYHPLPPPPLLYFRTICLDTIVPSKTSYLTNGRIPVGWRIFLPGELGFRLKYENAFGRPPVLPSVTNQPYGPLPIGHKDGLGLWSRSLEPVQWFLSTFRNGAVSPSLKVYLQFINHKDGLVWYRTSPMVSPLSKGLSIVSTIRMVLSDIEPVRWFPPSLKVYL